MSLLKSKIAAYPSEGISPWMRGFILLAGVYNLVWGFYIFCFPDHFYSWLTESRRAGGNIVLIQGAGVIMFGLFYVLSSLYPVRFWYLIFVGLLSKIFGAIWVFNFVVNKAVTNHFIFHVLVNDIAWLWPLAVVTYKSFRLRKKLLHTYEKTASVD